MARLEYEQPEGELTFTQHDVATSKGMKQRIEMERFQNEVPAGNTDSAPLQPGNEHIYRGNGKWNRIT